MLNREERPNRARGTLRDALRFSFFALIATVGGFLNAFFGALLLGPATWGIWQEARLVLLYGANSGLGVQNGMHREIPILRGEQDHRKQVVVTDVAFLVSVLYAVVLSSGILLATFLVHLGPELKLSLRFVSAMAFILHMNIFYGTLFYSRNEFRLASLISGMNGLLDVVSVALIFFYGLTGLLVGQTLKLAVTTWYSYRKSAFSFSWQWNAREFKSLVSIGFPIMLISLLNLVLPTVDRLVVLSLLGVAETGVYSIGSVVFGPLATVLSASGYVLYTRFGERYGERKEADALKHSLTAALENIALVAPTFLGTIYVALPVLISRFLPKYTGGVTPARILLFGLFFYGIAGVPGNLLLTVNRHFARLFSLLGAVALSVALSFMAIRHGYGLPGVATATSVSYTAFCALTTILALHCVKVSRSEALSFLRRVVGPVICSLALAVLAGVLVPPDVTNLGVTLRRTAVAEVALVASNGFFLYKAFATARSAFPSRR